MAHYLIIHESGETATTEAKNITAAAKLALGGDGDCATIYRVAGPGKKVSARVEKRLHIEISEDIEP